MNGKSLISAAAGVDRRRWQSGWTDGTVTKIELVKSQMERERDRER